MCLGCSFCRPCLSQYVTMAIKENMAAPNITCPDARCPKNDRGARHRVSMSTLGMQWAAPLNRISSQEVELLVEPSTLQLFRKLKLEYDVDRDPWRAWCPTANCDTICHLSRDQGGVPTSASAHSLASRGSQSRLVSQAHKSPQVSIAQCNYRLASHAKSHTMVLRNCRM